MFLRFLLALPIVFIPNAIHFAGETSIAGLNFTNMMFLVLLVMVPLLAPEGAPRLSGHGRLSAALIFLFAAYILAFVLAQLLAPSDLKEDLTYLKTAIFYPLLYFMYRNCRMDLRATRQLIVRRSWSGSFAMRCGFISKATPRAESVAKAAWMSGTL